MSHLQGDRSFEEKLSKISLNQIRTIIEVLLIMNRVKVQSDPDSVNSTGKASALIESKINRIESSKFINKKKNLS